MRKVLHIYTTPPYKVGGIMTILSAYKEHAALFHEQGYEYERLDIPYRTHIWSPVDNLIYIVTQQLAVARRLRRRDVSVVHIHTSRGYLFAKDMLLSLFIHFLFKLPVCLTVHMASMSAIFHRIGWMKGLSRWVMNHCMHRVFFLSEATRADFVQSGVREDIAKVLYNFHNLKSRQTSQTLQTPQTRFLSLVEGQTLQLLFVGALCERKGILDLLKACNKITDVDFKLNICGNVLEPVVEETMNDYATVLGRKLVYHGVKGGSGKTFLSINLASVFGIQKDTRVAVVDLDIRKTTLSRMVGKPEFGVSNYLGGFKDDWHELMHPLEETPNVDVLPVGTIPPNPTELLQSEQLATLLQEMRKEYDIIFLDMPPVEIVADVTIVKHLADITLFVVRVGNLDRSMLPVIENYYKDKIFNNLAILLNGSDMHSRRYGYGRYGYGYGY